MSDIVERIDSALTGITPGKWEWEAGSYETWNSQKQEHVEISCLKALRSEAGSVIVPENYDYDGNCEVDISQPDAALIAAAPDLLREAKAEIERLRAWLAEIGSLADVEADERSWMVRWALEGKTIPER